MARIDAMTRFDELSKSDVKDYAKRICALANRHLNVFCRYRVTYSFDKEERLPHVCIVLEAAMPFRVYFEVTYNHLYAGCDNANGGTHESLMCKDTAIADMSIETVTLEIEKVLPALTNALYDAL